MKQKQNLLIIFATLCLLISANSHAGRQGISFYYGLGLGAAAPADVDITATGDVIFGIEEDGWALEGIAFKSMEAGMDNSATEEYSISGSSIGLAYRTIENNNSYYKFKVSSTSMDFDYTTQQTDDSSGNSYAFGMGWRMDREARMEVEYNYYDVDEFNDAIHLITFSYLWGGSAYQGKSF